MARLKDVPVNCGTCYKLTCPTRTCAECGILNGFPYWQNRPGEEALTEDKCRAVSGTFTSPPQTATEPTKE